MSTPSILSAMQKLKSLLTREEKFKWGAIVGFALCTSMLEVVTATVIVAFSQILTQPEVGQKYLLMLGFKVNLSSERIVLYATIMVGVIYLIKNMVAAAEVFYQNFSIQQMNYHFKNKLLHRYAEADYGYYLTRNSSLGVAVVGGDADTTFSVGMLALGIILSETIVFSCLITMLVIMNPYLASIIFVLGIIIGIVISRVLLPQFYRWGQRLQETTLHSGQNLLQFFQAFKEVVLFGKRVFFVEAYQNHSYKKSQIQAIQASVNAMPRMVIEVLFVGLFVATITFLCVEHTQPVQMIGILGGYLYAGFRLMPGLNRIINQANIFKSIIPSIERVYIEYNTANNKCQYVNIPKFHFKHSLKLTDTSFRYLKAENDSLSNITLEIKKNESIGIVGETGSGKSTLVDIILGLLKPYKGSVLIDNQYPVNSYQWHQRIGYVPQSIYLLDDNIERNIAFGEKYIDETKLKFAINAAQLTRFIEQLPNGSKTTVGERGVRLSGGERQRVAIARALYHNPEILIFDEATSALDNETEMRLMETIYSVSQNRTVIMIAHRLTTLKDCDRIVMMEKGMVKNIIPYELLDNLINKRETHA